MRFIIAAILILLTQSAWANCAAQPMQTFRAKIVSVSPIYQDNRKRSYCEISFQANNKTLHGVSERLCGFEVGQKLFLEESIKCCDTYPVGDFGCYIPKRAAGKLVAGHERSAPVYERVSFGGLILRRSLNVMMIAARALGAVFNEIDLILPAERPLVYGGFIRSVSAMKRDDNGMPYCWVKLELDNPGGSSLPAYQVQAVSKKDELCNADLDKYSLFTEDPPRCDDDKTDLGCSILKLSSEKEVLDLKGKVQRYRAYISEDSYYRSSRKSAFIRIALLIFIVIAFFTLLTLASRIIILVFRKGIRTVQAIFHKNLP